MAVPPGSGFGDASERYLSALRGAGIPMTWSPLIWPSSVWQTDFGPAGPGDQVCPDMHSLVHADIVHRPIDHDTIVVHSTPLWHEQLRTAASGRRLIAYTTWETDRLPQGVVDLLNRYQRVVVPSQFNAGVFEDSGVTVPLAVVPHIAHRAPAKPHRSAPTAARPFVFYVIATWTSRKAVADTVEAFVRAFDENDPVALVVHTSAEDLVAQYRINHGSQPSTRHGGSSWMAMAEAIAGRKRLPEIRLSSERRSAAEVANLHRSGDCFVSLSRGEGFGLGAFEAGSYGNPAVVTGWGGQLEYLPPGYPYRAEFDLVPTASDPPDAWWHPQPGESWAKVRVDHAATLLRDVYEHRDTALAWGQRLREHIEAHFTIEPVMPALMATLDS